MLSVLHYGKRIHWCLVVSNLVFYAQSPMAVISGRNIFCFHTVIVKNVNMLKLVYVKS